MAIEHASVNDYILLHLSNEMSVRCKLLKILHKIDSISSLHPYAPINFGV